MSSTNRGAPRILETLFSVIVALAVLGGGGCVGPTEEPGGSGGTGGAPTVIPTTVPSTKPVSTTLPSGGNVLSVTVNGSQCGNPSYQYANEPCVSVTICAPGKTGAADCQTIDNILLDTGSFGLRLFKSLVTVPLTPIAPSTGASLAECVQFGDGSSEWGPVANADVYLASEPAATVPIMLIDSTYATPPAACSASQSRPDTGPTETGFNGILGVGVFAQDCGSACATDPDNGEYFSCTGTTCKASAASLDPNQQVSSPISAIPKDLDGISDSNGSILSLPSVAAGGVASLNGSLIIGIGTRSNNAPGSVTVLSADENVEFSVDFPDYSSSPFMGFLDSGSSVLFFPPPSNASILPDCDSTAGGSHGTSYKGFYCPSTPQTLTATNVGTGGASQRSAVSFQVDNAYTLFQSDNRVFSTMADSSAIGADAVFDWGLPFFYGRNVVVGIQGATSTLCPAPCAEPYWAY